MLTYYVNIHFNVVTFTKFQRSFCNHSFCPTCLRLPDDSKKTMSLNGDVYPCFGCKTPLVNLKEDSLSKAVKILIHEYWKKTLEKSSNMQKCLGCEFKYTCNSCKFINIDESCTYNLEEGIWK